MQGSSPQLRNPRPWWTALPEYLPSNTTSTKPNQVCLFLGFHREEVPDLSPANTQTCTCLLLKWNMLYLYMIYTFFPVLFKSSLTTYNNQYYVSDCISCCYTILALNLYFLSHDCTVFLATKYFQLWLLESEDVGPSVPTA